MNLLHLLIVLKQTKEISEIKTHLSPSTKEAPSLYQSSCPGVGIGFPLASHTRVLLYPNAWETSGDWTLIRG